jgi:hypothetical protein
MGQRSGFSSGDIEKINRMYNCNRNGVSGPSPGEGPNPNPNPTGPGPVAPGPNPAGPFGGRPGQAVAGAIFTGLGNLLGALG